MKNVSIYGKKWLDLVFEGKNKEYGAYQLRQENEKTSALALVFGITFLAGFVFLLSSFSSNSNTLPTPEKDGTTVIIDRVFYPPTTPNNPTVKPPKVIETLPAIELPNGKMVVARKIEAVLKVPTNAEIPITPSSPNGNSTGTIPQTNSNSGEGSPTKVNSPITNGPVGTSELDRQPNFPGGIKKFYEFVGENFDKDNIEEGQTVRITMSFVIEKNGTLTDIKVIEKTNSTITKEAIRVLKSLKTKWSPGYKDGQPVRAYFTLPLSVVI